MLSSKKMRSSLRLLRTRVSLKGVPHLQPVFLLQITVAVSQALNGSAVQAETLARGLVLDGRRRLSMLPRAAPHLSVSREHILRLACSYERDIHKLSAEESAVQALLELCLGLVLQWLSRSDHRTHFALSTAPLNCLSFLNFSFPFVFLPSLLPARARSCPTQQP